MPKVLHTLCYTKTCVSFEKANKLLARLSKQPDFLGGVIDYEESSTSLSILTAVQPLLPLLFGENRTFTIPETPLQATLRVFFPWDENVYLPLPYLPDECTFTVIPEYVRDEYGILPTVEFTEAFDPPSPEEKE